MKNAKGSVVVCTRGNTLALRLPRYLFNGIQKYIYLGIPDNPINRQSALNRAQIITSDIAFDRFDYSLEKYKPEAIINSDLSLCELWGKYSQFKSKTLANSTLDRDFKRIKNHLANLPNDSLKNAKQIRRHLVENLSAASAKRILMYLSACCNWALQEEFIKFNPFKDLPAVKAFKTKTIDPFTKAERDQIISAFECDRYYKHYANFVKFFFLTGCRTSEAVGLQWKHISPDLETITFSEAVVNKIRKGTKTGVVRRFPVNDQLKNLLATIKPVNPQPNDLVFPSPKGVAIDSHNFLNKAWKGVLGKLPIRYRCQYNTRHTFITLCLEQGVTLSQLAQWVGNSPETILKHYAGLISDQEVPEL
jgi:integrase